MEDNLKLNLKTFKYKSSFILKTISTICANKKIPFYAVRTEWVSSWKEIPEQFIVDIQQVAEDVEKALGYQRVFHRVIDQFVHLLRRPLQQLRAHR